MERDQKDQKTLQKLMREIAKKQNSIVLSKLV